MISLEEQRPGGPIPLPRYIPDDLTLPQFLLDSHHSTRPERSFGVPWFIDDETGKKIGAEEVRAYTTALANSLSARFDIKNNDVVSIFTTNHMNYPILIWAVHKLGAIVACSNPASTVEEYVYQCQLTKPTLIVASPGILDTAVQAGRMCGIPPQRVVPIGKASSTPPGVSKLSVYDLITEGMKKDQCFIETRLAPGEAKTKIAFYCFSSGTTGNPKAAVLSHYAIITQTLIITAVTKIGDDSVALERKFYRSSDSVLGILPFYHIIGILHFMHVLPFWGCTVIVVERFNFVKMLESIERYKIAQLSFVPPIAVLICKSPETKKFDLSSVRTIICTAAPFSAELAEHLSRILPGVHIGQVYGSTEVAGAVAWSNVDQKIVTPGCAGTILPGVVARVIRSDGSEADFNEPGELLVKMPTLALGYLNNEAATNETFVDGWLHTGDEVVINERREVYVTERIKEFLKVKGFQVAPAELEAHILTHTDADDVCVVGIADEYSGQLPLAFIVLSPAAQAGLKSQSTTLDQIRLDIMKHVSDHKSSYKHLAGVKFVDAIPKNPSGKLLRRVLRDQAKELQAAGKLDLLSRSKL